LKQFVGGWLINIIIFPEEINMAKQEAPIQQIALYKNTKINYTLTEATRISFERGPDLKASDFSGLDMLNYSGTVSLAKFLSELHVLDTWEVVDVGAGYGGPARFIANTYGCHVNAIEFLHQNARVGFVLNRLQGLQHKITYHCLDITQLDFVKQPHLDSTHHVLISQLAMLHILDKEKLYQAVGRLLKPEGYFYIEDYFLRVGKEFTVEERKILEHDVYVPNGSVPTKAEYVAFLEKNGLEVTSWIDVTEDWTSFVWNRYNDFLGNVENSTRDHGAEYVKDLSYFYKQVAVLFHGDKEFRCKFKHANNQITEDIPHQQHLGGVIIIGKKKH